MITVPMMSSQVARRYVLTAAHCVHPARYINMSEFTIMTGDQDTEVRDAGEQGLSSQSSKVTATVCVSCWG